MRIFIAKCRTTHWQRQKQHLQNADRINHPNQRMVIVTNEWGHSCFCCATKECCWISLSAICSMCIGIIAFVFTRSLAWWHWKVMKSFSKELRFVARRVNKMSSPERCWNSLWMGIFTTHIPSLGSVGLTRKPCHCCSAFTMRKTICMASHWQQCRQLPKDFSTVHSSVCCTWSLAFWHSPVCAQLEARSFFKAFTLNSNAPLAVASSDAFLCSDVHVFHSTTSSFFKLENFFVWHLFRVYFGIRWVLGAFLCCI